MRPLPEYAFTGREKHRPQGTFGKFERVQGWIKMKLLTRTCVLSFVLPAAMASLVVMSTQAQAPNEIGGQKVVTLTRTATSKTQPELTSVTVMPGRGMELLQIT